MVGLAFEGTARAKDPGDHARGKDCEPTSKDAVVTVNVAVALTFSSTHAEHQVAGSRPSVTLPQGFGFHPPLKTTKFKGRQLGERLGLRICTWKGPRNTVTVALRMCFGRATDDEQRRSLARTKQIDTVIRKEAKDKVREVKLLLLGAGESGKSTVLKQMKLIYAQGFSKAEREDCRSTIFSNLVTAFRTIFKAMDELDLNFENPDNDKYVPLIGIERELGTNDTMPVDYLHAFKSLWADEGVKQAIVKGNDFFHDIDRLFAQDYLPTDQDVLRSRLRTTGITETVFNLDNLTYRMFDVGGQRSERKKWIHCFENVTCLLFLVAISGYDQCLVEDKDANQMREALMLFESIANSKWFSRSAIILFLNKIDLFRNKIGESPIPKYFPEYTGDPTDLKVACRFFDEKFRSLNKNPNKEIYTHFTNATDTNLLKITMTSVQDMIIQTNLHQLIL
ncbi:MAG: G-Protein alpha subunit [Lichina confinis]|nr:MAG: G-Protein alpha subunit [Lichina confinis]